MKHHLLTRLSVLPVLLALAACPTTPPAPGTQPVLLLAYLSRDRAAGPPGVRLRSSVDGLAWTTAGSSPGQGDSFSVRGVGVADLNGIERLAGWVAGGSSTRLQYGLGSVWESSLGERTRPLPAGGPGDADSPFYDSAPSLMALGAGRWLVTQRLDGRPSAFTYQPASRTFEDAPALGGPLAGGAQARQRPVLAGDGTHFALAFPVVGTPDTPAVQMMTGTVAAGAVMPAGQILSAIVASRPPAQPLVVTRRLDGSFSTVIDTCLAADGRGQFMLGLIEAPARLDGGRLQPLAGDVTVRTFLARGADFPDAQNSNHGGFAPQVHWTPWTANVQPAATARYLQCAFKPVPVLQALVLTLGDGGAASWSIENAPAPSALNGLNNLNPIRQPGGTVRAEEPGALDFRPLDQVTSAPFALLRVGPLPALRGP